MQLREVRPVRLEYLALVTDLLQRQRLADPFAGLWEAADLQWWWRTRIGRGLVSRSVRGSTNLPTPDFVDTRLALPNVDTKNWREHCTSSLQAIVAFLMYPGATSRLLFDTTTRGRWSRDKPSPLPIEGTDLMETT